MSDTDRRVCAYWVYVKDLGRSVCVATHGEYTSQNWTADDITFYNQGTDGAADYGECDGAGGQDLAWVCSKYSPGGIAFGTWDAETGVYRLPFICDLYNLRAKISKCCYWDNYIGDDYTINQLTGQINKPPNNCLKGEDASDWNDPPQPEGPLVDPDELFELPCNGAKAECVFYTGIKWEHCIDEKMREGDFISGQQILELRYHYAEEWSPLPVSKLFKFGDHIYAWHGNFIPVDDDGTLSEEVDYPVRGVENFAIMDKVILDEDTGAISVEKYIPSGGSKAEDKQPTYPDLIESLRDAVPFFPRIFFPENNYNHKHWLPDGNAIKIIGSALGADSIYAVNSLVVPLPSSITKIVAKIVTDGYIDSDPQEFFNIQMEAFLGSLIIAGEGIYLGSVDTKSGYFTIEDVELTIGKKQDLYVFVKDVDGDWTVATVAVTDAFHHAYILQTSFEGASHTDGHLDSGVAAGQFHKTSNTAAETGTSITLEDFYWANLDLYPLIGGDTTWGSTYTVKVTQPQWKNTEDDLWRFIGACGAILAKVPDSHLNRPFGWGVESANLVNDIGTTELEVDYYGSSEERMPANYVILSPKEGESFKKGDEEFELQLDYFYYDERQGPLGDLEDNEEVSSRPDRIEGPRHGVSYNNNTFSISGIERTMTYRATFKDEDSRILGYKTQTMLVQYRQTQCPDYEVNYAWDATYTLYRWYPSYWVMGVEEIPWDEKIVGEATLSETPVCGDHSSGFWSGIGPMWYPYTACNDYMQYHTYTPGGSCYMEINFPLGQPAGPSTIEKIHRYRGPDQKYAEYFGDPYPAVWACKVEYHFGYYQSDDQVPIFNGRGELRGDVDLVEFRSHDWALPIFGNVLRQEAWLNRSLKYLPYWVIGVGGLYVDWKWMPMFPGSSSIEDLFSEEDVNPFLFFKCSDSGGLSVGEEHEEVSDLKHDDIFVNRHFLNVQAASYPGQDWLDFTEANMQWVWRGAWLDIERGPAGEKVDPALLSYAPYVETYEEIEVQKTAEEGTYDFVFNPPEYNEAGEIKTDAYFQLGTGAKKYIDLETVEFKNESVMVGGGAEDSAYKYWYTESDWDAEPNLWTGPGGSKGSAEVYENPEGTSHYFFKGVNLQIRSALFPYEVAEDYLSGDEYDTSVERTSGVTGHPIRDYETGGANPYSGGRLSPTTGTLDDISLMWSPDKRGDDKVLIFDIGRSVALTEIKLRFIEGPTKTTFTAGLDEETYIGIFPGAFIVGSNDKIEWELWNFLSPFDNYDEVSRLKKSRVTALVTDVESPSGFTISQRFRYYKLIFGPWEDDNQTLLLMSVYFKEINFIEQSEKVKLYERKYYISRGTTHTINFFGEDNTLLFPDEEKSSYYLHDGFVSNIIGDSEYQTACKSRTRSASEKYEDYAYDWRERDSAIVAESKQELLFFGAQELLGDTTSYTLELPQAYSDYLGSYGLSFPTSYSLDMTTMGLSHEDFLNTYGDTTEGIPGQFYGGWMAEGHAYYPDYENVYQDTCGGIPSPWYYRRTAWTADYCYVHEHDGLEEDCKGPVSPFYVYTNTILALAMNPTTADSV